MRHVMSSKRSLARCREGVSKTRRLWYKESMKNFRGSNPDPVPGGSDRHDVIPPHIENLFHSPIDFFALLDEIPIGVVVLDLNRRIVLLNQTLKALTGFSQQEACGLACRHILRSSACIQNCPVRTIHAESGPVCVESNLINRARQLIPIRITAAPIRDVQGQLAGYIETIEDIRSLRKMDEKAGHAYSFDHLIGRSPEMEKIFQILPSLAQSDSSVLITGETGTGKDMVAEALHQASNRAKGPFIKINCGALPETLLESELFGHRKGAFTGAVENKPGRFHLAHNGTLYLTEIGDLPLSLQVKLLTFLDDKVVFPLGSTKGFLANVRVIAATHRNLEKMVREGRFRKDLLFRLNVVRLHLPPLYQRQGDVRLLLDHFLNTLAAQLGRKPPDFSRQALRVLLAYRYPGNVRELRNIVEYAMNICDGDRIQRKHLPAYLTETGPDGTLSVHESHDPRAGGGAAGDPFLTPNLEKDWPDMEKRMILEALVKTGGRRHKAAAALGWARSTLWRKMKQYGISG